MSDLEVFLSGLRLGDEAIGLIVHRLASECHQFAVAYGIPSQSVKSQLGLVLDVLNGYLPDMFRFGPVVASGASGLAMHIAFNPETYRLVAQAAKDRVADAVD